MTHNHDRLLPEDRNCYIFTELPKAGTVESIEALLPGDLEKVQIKAS